jgi:hypothetical protein
MQEGERGRVQKVYLKKEALWGRFVAKRLCSEESGYMALFFKNLNQYIYVASHMFYIFKLKC